MDKLKDSWVTNGKIHAKSPKLFMCAESRRAAFSKHKKLMLTQDDEQNKTKVKTNQ